MIDLCRAAALRPSASVCRGDFSDPAESTAVSVIRRLCCNLLHISTGISGSFFPLAERRITQLCDPAGETTPMWNTRFIELHDCN